MRHLSLTTLTAVEQPLFLRDHLIMSFALGTGLRLAELVGLNVGDVCEACQPADEDGERPPRR